MGTHDGEQVPQDLGRIPEGASPLRYISAVAEGGTYVSYRTLEQAMADPDAAMVFEADSGGQILLSCPVRSVRASETALTQLLTDLEMITWGPGYDPDQRAPSDAEMFFEHLPQGSGVAGLWLHDELEELGLRSQIQRIIEGGIPRVTLPHDFPNNEFGTLAESRPYPLARVHLLSSIRGDVLVNALASMIHANEDRLLRLIRQLDAILETERPLHPSAGWRVASRLRIVPAETDAEAGGGRHVRAPLILFRNCLGQPVEPLERNRASIMAVLTGQEAEIR